MTDVPIDVVVNSGKAESGSQRVVRSLDDIEKKAVKTDQATGRLNKRLIETDSAASVAKRGLAALAGALGVRELVRISDTYKLIEGRLKLVTTNSENLAAVQQRLFNIAQQSRVSYEATAQLYTRVALSAKNLGKSQEDILKITQTVNQALQVGGATASEASAGVTQLSQALAAGTLRGDEFRSVLENMPRIAIALETALGKTRGELIQLSQDGKLTSKTVADALLSQGTTIAKEFDKIPLTVGQALTKVQNSFGMLINNINKGFPIFDKLAQAVDFFATNSGAMETGLLAIGVAAAVAFPQMTAIAVSIGIVATAVVELRKAFPGLDGALSKTADYLAEIGGPITLLKGMFITLVGELLKAGNSIGNIAVAMYEAFKTPFQKIGRLFDAFVLDLKDFISNPFSGEGFTNLSKELDKGFVSTFAEAFKKVRAEGKAFNKDIDKEIANRLMDMTNGVKDLSGAIGTEGGGGLTTNTEGLVKKQKDLKQLVEDMRTPLEQYNARLMELNALSKIATTGEEKLAITRGIAKAKEDLEDLQAQGSATAEIYKNAAADIKDSFDDLFKGVFKDGTLEVDNFLDNMLDGFSNTLAEMATLALAKPILIPVVTALGGSLGLGGGELRQITGELGGSPTEGISGLTDLMNLSKLGDLLNGGFGFNSGMAQGVSSLLNGGSFNAIGPQMPTTLGNAAGRAFSPGGMIGGFAGNFGANAIFGSDRGIGADIGGTIGGIAGSFIPVPVLGPMIGAFIGNAIGGMFGPGKGTVASEFTSVVDEGVLGKASLGSKRADTSFAKSVSEATRGVFEGLKTLGLSSSSATLRGGINTNQRGGGFLEFNDEIIKFDEKSEESLSEALGKLAITMAKTANTSNESLATALENIETEGRSVADVLGDLEFAKNFDSLFDTVPILTQYEQKQKDLKASYEAALETTKRLGLSEEKLEQARQKGLATITKSFNNDIQAQITQFNNPLMAQLQGLEANQEIRRRDAVAAGGNLVEVERLFGIERSTLLKQNLINQESDLRASIDRQKGYLDGIAKLQDKLSLDTRLSGTNSQGRAAEADLQLQNLATRIASKDETVFKDLDGTITASLNAALDYYGSTAPYLERLAKSDEILKAAAELARGSLSTEERMLDEISLQTGTQVSLLEEARKQTDLLNAQYSAASTDIAKIGGVDIKKLLNEGDDISVLSNRNEKNDLPEQIVRAAKLISSNGQFDFSKPQYGAGGMSFDQFVHSVSGGADILERFNNIISGFGGKPQGFAAGTGYSTFSGLARVGEQGEELVNFGRPVQIFSNAQSSEMMGGGGNAEAFNEGFARYARQSSEETTYLGGLLQSLLNEVQELNDNIGIGGLRG